MQCTSPIWIDPYKKKRVPRALFLKGILDPGWLLVGCGHCRACRIARAREWATRIMHEVPYHQFSSFCTLTYDDDHLPEDEAVDKRAFQLFVKRLRRGLGDRRIKYYACGEYGEEKGRAHYHACVFGLEARRAYDVRRRVWIESGQDVEVLKDAWPLGEVHSGQVSYDSARYVADYIGKDDRAEAYGGRAPPFQLVSQGLGRSFADEHADRLRRDLGCTIHGAQVGLPKYYRKRLEITAEELKPRALERQQEVIEKLIDYDLRGVSLREAEAIGRHQTDLNIQARQRRWKKGKL